MTLVALSKQNLRQIPLIAVLLVVRQTISKWEQGLSVPDADMLISISEIFETSVSTLAVGVILHAFEWLLFSFTLPSKRSTTVSRLSTISQKVNAVALMAIRFVNQSFCRSYTDAYRKKAIA